MRILVTGGAGFVGSHLCDRLIAEGHHVVALDSFLTGSRDNLRHLEGHARFELVRHDVIEPFHLPAIDRVYHLACAASPPHYQRDPIHTTLTSVVGTRHALALAKRTGARLVQASTSEIYGDPDVHPQPEAYRGNVNPIGPRACYDEGKRCAESLVMDYRRSHRVDGRIARIFNTYGPRMAFDDGRVVSALVLQALQGHELTIFGDGRQTRSFCFVDDLVDGLIRLMEHPHESGPVNLGNPEELTMLDLAEKIRATIGGAARIVFRPLPVDDPRQRKPVIDRAREILGFEPRVGLDDGLRRTIEDFRVRLRAKGAGGLALGAQSGA